MCDIRIIFSNGVKFNKYELSTHNLGTYFVIFDYTTEGCQET